MAPTLEPPKFTNFFLRKLNLGPHDHETRPRNTTEVQFGTSSLIAAMLHQLVEWFGHVVTLPKRG